MHKGRRVYNSMMRCGYPEPKHMNIVEPDGWCSKPRLIKRILAALVPLALLFAIWPRDLLGQDAKPRQWRQRHRRSMRRKLPINCNSWSRRSRCYPDSLVAQILAASTFPEQIVEAERWLQEHPDLQGAALAQAVDHNLGTPASRRSPHFRRCSAIWTRTFPGRHLWAMPTTISSRM